MDALLHSLTALIVGLSACYFLGMVVLGARSTRRAEATLGSQASLRYGDPAADLGLPGADPASVERYHVYYLVPCLDEALVIGGTIRFLSGSAGDATVIVVDDASEDGTGEAATLAAGRGHVVVVRRELPDARQGKGPALNAGFAELVRLVRERGQDPERVVVVVMDADGHLSRGALTVVLPLFDEPAVGGVQLAVRIRNRKNWLTQFQNFQFWTMSAMTQLGRMRTGTVSLGGNGQFTRLSALLELGGAPWRPSLTEDLDLAVSLITNGWRLTSTPHAAVDQQGVETLRRLLTQRTRWYQGHMTAGRRIPELWRSNRVGHGSAMEAILYLLVPWVLDLPWSILYHVALVRVALHVSEHGVIGAPNTAVAVLLTYVVAFYPALITALLCRRRDPRIGALRSIALGHSFVAMNYLSWTCCWRALFRMVRGRTGWDKTARHEEVGMEPVQRSRPAEEPTRSASPIAAVPVPTAVAAPVPPEAEPTASADIAIVLGTRPEAIKLFVLVELLGPRALVVHTGQHFDDELAAGVNADIRLPTPDVQLGLGGMARGAQIGLGTSMLTRLFSERRPAVVVVQGDTNAGLAGALAANAEGIALVHVEAGLRSLDRAMPEEHNRVVIDHLADLCLAPTGVAADNLIAEGIPPERIVVTGNTVVDAVQRMVPDADRRSELRRRYGVGDERYVLATLHRPENVDSKEALRAALEGLGAVPAVVLFPMHPRTASRVRRFGLDHLLEGVRVVPPLPPTDFLGLAREAALLVSDSGGIQEEASVLKRRVLVVRRSTERPEALGTFSELVAPDRIEERTRWHLDGPGLARDVSAEPSPFGDGHASQRIAELVCAMVTTTAAPLPSAMPPLAAGAP